MAIDQIISFKPENDAKFQLWLNKLAENTDDFSKPFNLIANHWYKSNRKIFALKSPGKYQDLAPAAAKGVGGVTTSSFYKQRKWNSLGFIYPILRGKTRKLENSILSKTAEDSVFFVGKKSLTMGTDVKYAKYHQSDRPRSVIPQRKFIFIDAKGDAKDVPVAGRLEIWINIIDSYIKSLIKA